METPPGPPTPPARQASRAPGVQPLRATATGAYREVTVSAVVFGIVIGAFMNAAITYAGLKIGFTLGGSAIAAVLGFGVLRGLLRRGSILETNIGQTIASAVNTTNAGVIFTVPVLMLLGYRLSYDQLDFWLITLACIAGALLGCVFIVPLRKQMLDIDRLRFPSATAVGAILKSPGAGAKKSVVLGVGIVLAMVLYLPVVLPDLKSPAELGQLESLIARERVTPEGAALTREIAAWIEAERAPEAVVEFGRLHAELRGARAALAEDDESAELKARVEELEEAVKAQTEMKRYPGRLAVAAREATLGEREWASLRSTELGWAAERLWGYQDLGWRLGAERDAQTGALTTRVDRDGNGAPDLVLTDSRIDVGRLLGLPAEMSFVFALAPFALGAGYLTGRAGLLVLAGGVLAYLVLNPLAYNMGWIPATVPAHEAPGYALKAFNQPLGIGLLLGGAMMGVLASMPAIREAMRSVLVAGKSRAGAAGGGVDRSGDEMGFAPLAIIACGAMLLLLVAVEFGGAGGAAEMTGALKVLPTWLGRAVIVLVAAAWIWFAGIIIAQCTGMTDWSPISGIALLTVVLVMLLAGSQDVVSAVMLGAALCVAISCAADMMADLKTGYIVGGVPRRQQVLEIATAGIGPIITMGTILLIATVNTRQYGVAFGPETPTVAPQAQALEVVVRGVQGGEMPYALYGLGAVLGGLLGLGAFAGLGVLVGLSMYLPIFYILTYGVGCLANMAVGKLKGRAWAEEWGVPFCAGLIVGEAVLALVINSIVLVGG